MPDHVSDEELLHRYAEGSLSARETLARRHMPMARRLAARHRRSSEPAEDLEQVAYLGLLKTIDRYDPGLGSFVGYAVTTIRGELKRHFRDHGWTMHVTRPVQERYLKVTAEADGLTTSLGRPATVKELAAKTGLMVDEVVEALDAGHGYSPPSLDAPVGGEWGEPARTLGDTVGSVEAGFERVELGEAIGPAFRRLPERQQAMLRMRFLEDLTQSEIAARCGVSQMHVSRLLRRSLNALLESVEEENKVPTAAFG
jgi:RNA polymerase sigma-B factor